MGTKLKVLLCLFFLSFAFQAFPQKSLGKVLSYERTPKAIFFLCENGQNVKLSILKDEMFRVQVAPDANFKTTAMEKLGFVKIDFPTVNYDVTENSNGYKISTLTLNILIQKNTFRIMVTDKKDNIVLRENEKRGSEVGNGNILNFDMPADEHFFGFGFMRKTLDARGEKLMFKREYRWKEATVPYFMSTRGYAFYSNNVHNQEFDFTNKSNQESTNYFSITSDNGPIDYFIIYGPDFPKLLDQYTDLTGKSMMVPRWAFGLEYRLRYYGDAKELIDVAKTFREKEIPADIMALEPGWEEVAYSMDWKWSKERFPKPKKMIRELDSMGFKLDLWESGDAPTKNISDPKTREKWFDQRKRIIISGVKMFKQDDPYPRSILSSELLGPVLANNRLEDQLLDAEELNNVANSLYSQTFFQEYRKLTNERAIVMFHAYNASVASQRWPFQWAGDFQAANGMLNASLSGHAMVSYDIRNPYAAGWHQGFFTPFSVVDSWAYYREPWLYSESIEESHRLYACLRSRLVPYFYSSLWQAHTKALPIERPMVLNYSNNPNTYQMSSQFMVGDWLLLVLSDADDAPAGEKVDFWTGSQKGNEGRAYLPEGKWIDYWSGEERNMENAQWVTGKWPEYIGGLLFVKAGAIIPMGQVKNYIGETKDEVVVLDVYPEGDSSYELYEDDGISYDYEKGEYALTEISSKKQKNQVEITISARKGSYSNMPRKRSFVIKMHSLIKPKNIIVDGEILTHFNGGSDLLYDSSRNGWYYDAKSKKAIVKLDEGWAYSKKKEGVDPMATLPSTAKYERIIWDVNASVHSDKRRKVMVELPEKAVPVFTSNIAGLPADGYSRALVGIKFTNIKNPAGKIDLKVTGPAKFLDGSKVLATDTSNRSAHFTLVSENRPGTAKVIISGNGVEDTEFELPVYGKPINLKIEKENSVWIADNNSKLGVKATLYDKFDHKVLNVASPLLLKVKGEAFFENNKQMDTVHFVNGRALFNVRATLKPGLVELSSSFNGLKGNTLLANSEKGIMQVRINPPEKVKLNSDGYWIPDNVTLFINFRANGKLVHRGTNKVTLNVYNKKGKLLDTYVQNAKNGELVFKDITYYKRPAQCLFEVKSEGYETVTRKVFPNTWDVDPSTQKKR